jgi:hypothetical protein
MTLTEKTVPDTVLFVRGSCEMGEVQIDQVVIAGAE